MKTKNIESTFRNAATPAARLAAWQTPGYGNRPSLAGLLADRSRIVEDNETLAASI